MKLYLSLCLISRHVPEILVLQFVMRVSLVVMFVYLFLYRHLELLIILILYIVICGPPLLRVSLVTNIA